MEYLILLKKEVNTHIKKFNEMKKWFIHNLHIKPYFKYEDDISIYDITGNSFYIVSPNVIPLLNSVPMERIFQYQSNYVINSANNHIAYINLSESMKNKNKLDGITYSDFKEVFKKIPLKTDNLITHFKKTNYDSKYWFYVNDEEIKEMLDYFINNYFTWPFLNKIKLRIADRYPKIIYYDGKNKLESKKLVSNLGIKVPKTYEVLKSEKEITQKMLDKYTNCIIKPTHLDGSKLVFKQKKDKKISLKELKENLANFGMKLKNKELNPLILKKFKPRIIIEEYIPSMNGLYNSPLEFKFYVFNGEILFFLGINKNVDNSFDFFDEDYNKLEQGLFGYERKKENFIWPYLKYFPELKMDVIKIYNKFNEDLGNTVAGRFIRIDFYISKNEYYFGEFSLFPNGCTGSNLNPRGQRQMMVSWIPEVFDILENNKSFQEEERPLSFAQMILNYFFT